MKRIVPNPVMRALAFMLGVIGWGLYLFLNFVTCSIPEWFQETKRLCKEACRNDIID